MFYGFIYFSWGDYIFIGEGILFIDACILSLGLILSGKGDNYSES